MRDLRVLPFGPEKFPAPVKPAKTKEEAEALLVHAQFVVLERDCYAKKAKPAGLGGVFELITNRRKYGPFKPMELYRRRPSVPPRPLAP